jgi:hypothetical protein
MNTTPVDDGRAEIELELDEDIIQFLHEQAALHQCTVDDIVEQLLQLAIDQEKLRPGSSVVEPESLKFSVDGFESHPGHQNT